MWLHPSSRIYGNLQGSTYTMQVNSYQMKCFFLSFQQEQHYNRYMGLCMAAFILFAFQWNRYHYGCLGFCRAACILFESIPSKCTVSSFLSNISNVTMDIWDFARQHLYCLLFAFQQKHHHNRNLDFARQHIFLYIFFRLQVLSSLSTTSNLSVVNSRFYIR